MRLRVKWGSLRAKIIAWSFVPTAIILTFVALVAFYAYQQATQDLVVERNRELIRLSASQFSSELTEYTDILKQVERALGQSPYYVPALEAALQDWRNRLAVFDAGVVVMNEHGIVLAAAPARPEIIGQDWSDRPYFRHVVRASGPVFSDILNDGPGGVPVVLAVAPVLSARGEFIGATAGMFHVGAAATSDFYGRIVKLRLGGDATTYLVDSAGRVIYHADAGRIGENFSAQTAVQRVLFGQVDALRTRDVRGRRIVASFAPVPNTPWGLVSEVDWQTLLAPTRNYRLFLLFLLGLGVIIPTIVVGFGVRRITQPIVQLIAAAKEVANGKFGQTIEAHTGDELEELVQQFNRMSGELSESYAALKSSEERYGLVIRATNDGIWDWDTAGDTAYFSPRWKAMLGYEDHEIGNTRSQWRALMHPDDVSRVEQTLQDYLNSRSASYEVEFRLRHKNGTYLWILSRGMALRDAQGRPYRMLGSHTDITARKEAEQALQERLAFEKLVATISTEFINLGPEEFDAGLLRGLEAAGRSLNMDRARLFLLDDQRKLSCAQEWYAPGVEARPEAVFQVTYLECWPWIVAQMAGAQIVHIPRVDELPSEAQREREYMRAQGIKSLVIVPMTYRGQLVGFISFAAMRREATWAPANIAPLRIIGEIFVNALQHKRSQQALQQAYQTLERRVEERTHELATLNAISAVINRSLDLKETLTDALEKTLEAVGMECGGAYRLETDGDQEPRLRPLLYRGLSESFIRSAGPFPLRGSAVERAIHSEEPLVWDPLAPDVDADTRARTECEGIRQVVTIPLLAKGKLVGALQLATRRPRAFTGDQLSLLSAIGRQAGVALENARLYEQAEQTAAVVERTRLARELHDSVTQSLYSVTLYAEAAARVLAAGDVQTAGEHLRELRDTAQEALREMRLLIFELRPPALEKSGLVAALQARLEAVEVRGGLRTELQVEGAQGVERLPVVVQNELYQIAREALNNSLKHARARSVRVRLRFLEQLTMLEIYDDGIGFTPAIAIEGGGLGMESMEERARRIGARLYIESAPGQGAKVRVEVPVGGGA